MSQLRRGAKKPEKHWKIYLQQNVAMQGDMFFYDTMGILMRLETHVICNHIATKLYPPKFNSSPLKSSNRKGLSSSHYFSGAMLVSGRVIYVYIKLNKGPLDLLVIR